MRVLVVAALLLAAVALVAPLARGQSDGEGDGSAQGGEAQSSPGSATAPAAPSDTGAPTAPLGATTPATPSGAAAPVTPPGGASSAPGGVDDEQDAAPQLEESTESHGDPYAGDPYEAEHPGDATVEGHDGSASAGHDAHSSDDPYADDPYATDPYDDDSDSD